MNKLLLVLVAFIAIFASYQAEAVNPGAVISRIFTAFTRGLRNMLNRHKVSDLVCIMPADVLNKMKIKHHCTKPKSEFSSDEKTMVTALSNLDSLFSPAEVNSPDMILDEEQKTQRAPAFIEGALCRVYVWPNGIIPYEIQPNPVQDRLKAFIWATILMELNVGVDFQEQPNGQLQANLDRNQAARSSAHIGYIKGRKRQINLGTESLATAFHELGHVLGLAHEQQRPDRDSYVKVPTPSKEPINYDKFWWIQDVLPYNFGSIMHYTLFDIDQVDKKVAVAADLPYAIQVDDVYVGKVETLNKYDLATLKALYPKNPAATEKDIEDCLFMKWVPPITVHNKCDKMITLTKMTAKLDGKVVATRVNRFLPQKMFAFMTHKRANSVEIEWSYAPENGKVIRSTTAWKASYDCTFHEMAMVSTFKIDEKDKVFDQLNTLMPGTKTSFTSICADSFWPRDCGSNFEKSMEKRLNAEAQKAVVAPLPYEAWEHPTKTRKNKSKKLLSLESDFAMRVEGMKKDKGYIDIAICKGKSEPEIYQEFAKIRKAHPMPTFFDTPVSRKVSTANAEATLTRAYNAQKQ